MSWKILAATAIASPLLMAPAVAAPLSSSLALTNTDVAQVETVQWRRGGRWIGPAAGFAAGVAIGSVLAPSPSYYDYGYAPGYVYAPAYPYGYYDGTPSGPNHPGCNWENREDNPLCQ